MATIEWYDAETASVRKARFQGEQPQHVTEAIRRSKRWEVLCEAGCTAEEATAQCDAYEARHAEKEADRASAEVG